MGILYTSLFIAVLSAASLVGAVTLPACATAAAKPQYDYVVIGSGAGGGPLASRLAEAGYSGKSSFFVVYTMRFH
jgi:hypothetical protein